MFRYDGQPAIGLAISMTTGGDALEFGEQCRRAWASSSPTCPSASTSISSPTSRMSSKEAVGEFTKSLVEAVAIVLAVSFLALGLRAGVVVAVAIPLVLAITFVLMEYADISLQRISLGALIIALGLLVDDAMIAVEMMIARMEEGYAAAARRPSPTPRRPFRC